MVPFPSGTGWGYAILADGRTLIRQPHVPAVEGLRPFASRAEALRVGIHVQARLAAGRAPTVSRADLDSLLARSPSDDATSDLLPTP
ncbi:MAG: DUF4907 domain-containing protein [Bacteroidota bacterium]